MGALIYYTKGRKNDGAGEKKAAVAGSTEGSAFVHDSPIQEGWAQEKKQNTTLSLGAGADGQRRLRPWGKLDKNISNSEKLRPTPAAKRSAHRRKKTAVWCGR